MTKDDLKAILDVEPARDRGLCALVIAITLWMGIYPSSFIDVMAASVSNVVEGYETSVGGGSRPGPGQPPLTGGNCWGRPARMVALDLVAALPELFPGLRRHGAPDGRRVPAWRSDPAGDAAFGPDLGDGGGGGILLVGAAASNGADLRAKCSVVTDRFRRLSSKILVLLGVPALPWHHVAAAGHEHEDMARFELPGSHALCRTLGMMMMVSANDLISLYVGLELQSLSLYVLAAFRGLVCGPREAGLKYFVLGALSSGMLLYGCVHGLRLRRHHILYRPGGGLCSMATARR